MAAGAGADGAAGADPLSADRQSPAGGAGAAAAASSEGLAVGSAGGVAPGEGAEEDAAAEARRTDVGAVGSSLEAWLASGTPCGAEPTAALGALLQCAQWELQSAAGGAVEGSAGGAFDLELPIEHTGRELLLRHHRSWGMKQSLTCKRQRAAH